MLNSIDHFKEQRDFWLKFAATCRREHDQNTYFEKALFYEKLMQNKKEEKL